MVKNDLWYRIRGLDKMESRFGKNPIKRFIQRRLKQEKIVRVLEIGFGEGRCLIELRALFPDKRVELFGINNIKMGGMRKQADFITNAKKFGVHIDTHLLPKPYFYDAGNGLKFKDNYFDVVISQVAFHYVSDKAKLIEEIWRVLKPSGKAFLHIDEMPTSNYPDFMKINPETPRFTIYNKNGKLIKSKTYVADLRKKGYEIYLRNAYKKKNQRVLLIRKNNSKKLSLNLILDGNSTLNMSKMKRTDKYKTDGAVWWGTRSVYMTKK